METDTTPPERQLKKKRIADRSFNLLQSEQWSDCSFLVGSEPNQKIFKAHKIFLAMTSPVFEAMFYGGMPEKEKAIPILDVQPEAFKALLEYIYADVVNIKTFDRACEVCYAAKKYMLPDLVEQCTQRIFQNLYASNACKAYEFAKLFEEPTLMERSFEIVLSETEAVLADPSFEDVELSTLLLILDSETLSISSERDVFNAVYRWAKKECGRKGMPEEPDNLRQLVGTALQKVHFLTLTPLQFAEGPALTPLLTRDESFSILMNISNPGSSLNLPSGFSKVVEPRQRYRCPIPDANNRIELLGDDVRQLHRIFCTRNFSSIAPVLNSQQMDCSLCFTVDHNICLIGIQGSPGYGYGYPGCIFGRIRTNSGVTMRVFTLDATRSSEHVPTQTHSPGPLPLHGMYTELIYAHLLDSDNSRLTYTHYTSRVSFNQVIDINFNRPVYIQRNKLYKIVVVTNKPGYYPLGTVRQSVMTTNGVTFNFLPSPDDDSLIRTVIFG